MLTKHLSLNLPSLQDAIDRHPLTVTSDTTVQKVLELMTQHRVNCQIYLDQEDDEENTDPHSYSSCVLVLENSEIKGIFTSRDLVKLTAKSSSFAQITVGEVMKTPVLLLENTGQENIFTALSFFRQHSIREAPVIDSNGNLLGVATAETLRVSLQAHNLMRLQRVREVMASPVISRPPTVTVQEIGEVMANHSISCVVITNENTPAFYESKKLIPIGIITEGDILQLQTLQVDLATIYAGDVMSGPVFSLQPDDTLLQAKQQMQKRRIKHLIITGNDGELVGIVTPTSLLRGLDAVQICNVIETLQGQVDALQSENLRLLESRNQELETEVQNRTEQLQHQTEKQQLLTSMASRIRASIHLREIIDTTVSEVRQLLECERVLVYQTYGLPQSKIVAESVADGWEPSVNIEVSDLCINPLTGLEYLPQTKRVISDIQNANLSPCYLKLLERLQVKAYLVVPIFIEEEKQQPRFWGLLIAHQCRSTRRWETSELQLLEELELHISIAIQQAELFNRVQTELTRRQRAEAQVEETQKLLDLFYQSGSLGICITDEQGYFIQVNPAFCNISGYSEKELQGQTFVKILPPENRPSALDLYHNFLEDQTPIDTEWQLRRADGKVVDIYLNASPVVEENGRKVTVTSVADISQRKQAEQALKISEERYRALVDLSPDGIFISQKGIFRFVNMAVVKMLGYRSAKDLIGKPVLQVIHPDFHAIVKERIRLQEQEGISTDWLDEKYIRADGSEIHVEAGAKVIHLDGELASQVVLRDITVRKQAEEALRKSEERYRQMVETAIEGIWLIDEDNKTSFVNQRMAEMLGYGVDEMMGKSLFEFMDAEGLAIAHRNIERRKNNIKEQHDFKFIRKDGKSVYAIVSTNPFLDDAGHYCGALAMITDITDRKMAENALENLNEELQIRVSNRTVELAEAIQQLQQEIQEHKHTQQELILLKERLEYLISAGSAMIYSCKTEGSYPPTFMSENIKAILGYTAQEFLENPDFWASHIHPEDAGRVFRDLPALFKEGIHAHEYRFMAKNGQYRWLRDDLRLVRDEQGNPLEIVGSMIDITAQKQVEAKLQNALFELEFQNFALDQSAIISMTDAEGIITYVNQKFCEISGYSKDELIGETHVLMNSGYHSEEFYAQMWDTISQGKLWKGEFKNRAKNGSFYWVDTTILPVLDSQKKPIQYLSIRLDITERKKTEEELRKSEERFALSVEGVKDGIWDWHITTNEVYFSPQWKTMLGYTDDEIPNCFEEWEQRVHPDDKVKIAKIINDYLQGNLPIYEVEHRLRHKDGTYRWILTRGAALRCSTGTPYRMAGSHTDITERKQVEADLTKHQQYLTGIVEVQRQLLTAPVEKNLYQKILQILAPISNASRVYIFENHRDAEGRLLTSQRAEWCAADIEPQIDNPLLQNLPYDEFFPRWVENLSKGKIMQGNVADFPQVEKEVLEMQGIISILVLPLIVQGEFFGFIGFDNCVEKRQWDSLEVSLLMSVASAISLAKERQITQEALQQQLTAVEAATNGIAVLNQNGDYIYLNNAHLKLFGYDNPEQLLGKSWRELYCPTEADRVEHEAFFQLAKTGQWRGETTGKKRDGSLFSQEVFLTLIEGGGLICVCQDITYRKKAEEALQHAKDQLQAVLDAVPGLVSWIDSDLRYLGANRHLAAMFNLPPETFVGQEIGFLQQKTEFCDFLREFFVKSNQTASQSITLDIDGEARSYLIIAQKYQQGRACVSVGIDITERKQAEEQLKASLRDKEVLLKEIHHRVKNNLQVISSLLKLQSRYTQDRTTLDMLRESQNRVKSMALIHEKLYQSTNLASIDFAEYLGNLTSNLLYSYTVDVNAVKLEIKAENASLNIDTAIPCGLLMNELVSNALKHAFPQGRQGKIWVEFSALPEQKFLLTVKDNGVGFPESLDWENSGTLGLRLVNSLVNQIDGTVEIDRTEGTKFQIQFQELIYKSRN
ncbi:PAS domain S-box protein [Ancylothrix sp. C2]|uniref:PAS domain S-box protein n=1 Tax=Ancylothrix sp. D3o TaxID=2953691 RepID=UPI0021BB28E6|nr:PAS domain S-box protein [Ancylothrix sp. D3o]MCT7949572.1 PAS domain S-box protein [Ancylothrix sp. D3o]